MLRNPRHLLIAAGLLLLVGGGWLAWRAAHPPLTPEQQVAAQLEALRAAIEKRRASTILSHLAPEFTWGTTTRNELRSMLGPALFQWREVQLELSGVHVQAQGDAATSSGNFHIRYRQGDGVATESKSGQFRLHWRQKNGQWKIARAEGGENVGQQ